MHAALRLANTNVRGISKAYAAIVTMAFRLFSMAVLGLTAALVPSGGHADVKIASAATSNITCSAGLCVPTAKNAVLNVGDLENLLASGNVEVTTTGSGVQADNIDIDAGLTWSATNLLALDAHQSILVNDPVSVSGQGGLTMTTNDGGKNGYFGFGGKGQVSLPNLSSSLMINGANYTLVADLATLAADVAANPAGNFALANDFDASGDGTYQNSPIPTEFSGAFEGLGNTVSNLSLYGTGSFDDAVGLFAETGVNGQSGGNIENIQLENLQVNGNCFIVGGIVGFNRGSVAGSSVQGTIQSDFSGGENWGLLVGDNYGSVARSSAEGTMSTNQQGGIGGLVGPGGAGATIADSFANVKISGGANSYFGTLSAGSSGSITNSYAEGEITANPTSMAGGLVAGNASTISQSYSTTTLRMTGRKNHEAGGLIGVDYADPGSVTSSYWDTSTSNMRNAKQGAGTPKNDPGIKGLTTEQLQSGLPSGFDKKIWAENPKINNGFPYLIDNPPRK